MYLPKFFIIFLAEREGFGHNSLKPVATPPHAAKAAFRLSNPAEATQLLPLRYISNSLAEREGFEPSKGFKALTGLANQRTRPLCDLSVIDTDYS